MARYSRRQTAPIAIIAAAKTSPPATVIAIAKAIQGSATRTRLAVSPLRPRWRRGCRGGFGGGAGSSSNISSSKRSDRHQRAPKRRWRVSYSRSDSSKAARSKSGQSSSRKTSSE